MGSERKKSKRRLRRLMAVQGAAIQALMTQSALLIAARTLAIPRAADISS